MEKRRLGFVAGMIISAVFLFLAFRGLQPEQFMTSLGSVSLPLLLLATGIYFLALLIIAWRWQILLDAVKRVPLAELAQFVAIGYMGNNVYPLRAGDGLRILLLRRKRQVALLRATTVIAVEHLYNGTTMIAFILAGLAAIDLQSEAVEAIVRLVMPLVSLAILAALALTAKPGWLRRMVRWASRVLPSALGEAALRLSEDILAALEGLRSPRHFPRRLVGFIPDLGPGGRRLLAYAARLRPGLGLSRRVAACWNGQPGRDYSGLARASRRL